MYKSFFLALTVSLLSSGITLPERVTEESPTAAKNVNVAGEEKGPEYYRLPGGVKPLTYGLRMIPFLEDGNMTFRGDVTIKFLMTSTTNKISLHSKELNVTKLKIFKFDGPPKAEEIPLGNFHHEEDRDFLVVESKVTLSVNKTYALYMEFKGELNRENTGFYRSSYVVSEGKQRWIATTQFEPNSARMAFPCFDEPHLKANFSISIARHRGMNSLSNMIVKGPPAADPNLPKNYVWDHYKETPKMSTYLVAFVVSDFPGKAKDPKFRAWAREECINDVEYSLEVMPKVLDIMNNITLFKYPLPKTDMVAIPDFNFGAMENWGLVTYRESFLLFNNETSSTANKQQTTAIIAHEAVHQWFGDLVSPEWWTWIWLNEGFASYFTKVIVDMIEPSWRMMEQLVVEDLQIAQLSDSKSTHPMNCDIRNPEGTINFFNDITYKKAGSIIRMMANFLSEPTFYRGIQNYLRRRKYNSANEDHLFEAMDAQALIDKALPDNYSVSAIMDSWTTQTGYPVITITRDFESGEVTLKQERFTLDRTTNGNNTETWWIPITYTSMNSMNFEETKPMYWMKERNASFLLESLPTEDDWILFNLQQIGFYRVNYDEQNWLLISGYLSTSDYHNIPPVNRAQLINDALNLARGGYLNYSVALKLTTYLERESDYMPLYSAYQGFSFLERMMSESKELHNFEVHMRHIMKTYYNSRSFEESPKDDHVTKLSRSTILPWACKYYDNCVSKASKMFQDWKENRTKSIPPNLRSVAYCFGVRQGGNEDWNHLWEAFQKSSVPSEKELLLRSLGCSMNNATIYGFLEVTLDTTSGIRKHDIANVFTWAGNSPEGLDAVVTFVINRSEDMVTIFGAGKVGKIMNGVSSRISSKGLADKMRNFLTKIDDGPLKESAQKGIETISNNLAWIENYGPDIESWLNKQYSA